MIQSRAREILADFRGEVARVGYDQAPKHHLATVFMDLKYMFGNHKDKAFNEKKREAVSDLEALWQKSRVDPALHGGADNISEILARLERFIPDLPAEVKQEKQYFPPMFPPNTSDVQALIDETLKRREALANA